MEFDQKITQAVQDWLNAPEHGRDIKAGADLMLQLNRNRALYNSVLKSPEKLAPKLVYELRKYLRMRLDKVSAADVAQLERRIMPSAASALQAVPVISPDDEIPKGCHPLGRRPDHDELPAQIQALWESNAARYRQVNLLFNELKAMSHMQPCDRYEKLVLLDEAETAYRRSLALYDSYEPGSDAPIFADNERTVNNARKTLSKYRRVLAECEPSDPRRDVAIEKIQACVSAICACGAGIAPETRSELEPLGIRFD